MADFDREIQTRSGLNFVKGLTDIASYIVELIDAIGTSADNAMANFCKDLDLNINRLQIDEDKNEAHLYEAAIDVFNGNAIDYPILVYKYRTRKKDVQSIVGYIYASDITINDDQTVDMSFNPELHVTYKDGRKRMYDGSWHDEGEE